MPTLYLTWDVAGRSVTSITNYTKFKLSYREDCDATPINYCVYDVGQDMDQFRQELRLNGTAGALTFTAGAYYLNLSQDAPQRFAFPSLSGGDFAFDASNLVHQKTRDFGVFGQLEYQITSQVKLTGGVRWTYDHKTFDSVLVYNELGNGEGLGSTFYNPPLAAYVFNRQTAGGLADAKARMWSGKIQLDYKPVSDVLLYAGVSRGVKAPGFNGGINTGLTLEQTPYRSEFLYAYEAGAKLRLLNGRATLNTSAFYYDYHRYQGFAFVGVSPVVGNYPATFYGFETELNARLPAAIDLRLGASYLHTNVEGVNTTYDG